MEGCLAEMSRTRLRIVLILLALILVVTSILSGLLTRWAEAVHPPKSTPDDGEAGQPVFVSVRILRQSAQPGGQRPKALYGPCVAG